MSDHSCTDLLAILQRHGLTQGVLAAWVALCEQEKTGAFILHHHEGHLIRVTTRITEKVAMLSACPPQNSP